MSLPWFRLYHRIIDDEKVRLLAFEDRWHYIAILCMKADGILDEKKSELRTRKMALKMGLQVREVETVMKRLMEVGLVDKRENPVAWNKLQYSSDSSTARVKRYREKQKRNGDETLHKRSSNALDTDTDTDNPPNPPRGESVEPPGFEDFWKSYPRKTGKGDARKRWKKLKPSQELQRKILWAVAQHKQSEQWKRESGKYIPLPATWLNQERWDDEPEAGASRAAGGGFVV